MGDAYSDSRQSNIGPTSHHVWVAALTLDVPVDDDGKKRFTKSMWISDLVKSHGIHAWDARAAVDRFLKYWNRQYENDVQKIGNETYAIQVKTPEQVAEQKIKLAADELNDELEDTSEELLKVVFKMYPKTKQKILRVISEV